MPTFQNRFSKTLTLTAAATNYQLSALMIAAGYTGSLGLSELNITAQSDNLNPVLVGDSAISDSDYGMRLSATEAYRWGPTSETDVIDASQIYLRGVTTAGLKVQVEARTRL